LSRLFYGINSHIRTQSIQTHEYVSKAFNLYSTEHKGQHLEPTGHRIGESGNKRPQTKARIRNL